MPKLIKYVFHGTGATEEFQFGVAVSPDTGPTQAEIEQSVHGIRDNIEDDPTWWQHILSVLAPDQHYDEVRGYYYPDATGPASVSAVAAIGSPHGVGAGTLHNPLQIALCVTLLTGHSGSSYRGRCYVPATGMPWSNDHQADQAYMDNLGHGFAGATDGDDKLLRVIALNTQPDPAGAVVYSRTKNLTTTITSVRVDSRADIQRRRAMSESIARVSNYGVTGD